jgi:D-alanyl-D-alanine carboxypeptidase/D-alanyl-D-alanine-endopeptidase (penicillin-binding protein 4)
MIVIGLLLIAAATLIPYALSPSAQQTVVADAAFVPTKNVEGLRAAARATGDPIFDVATWYALRNEMPETHGVLIESLDGRRVFASHNADETFNPASLIKLATSLVALNKFSAAYRFQTRVFMQGAVDRAGTLEGALYISGDDPTFGDYGASLISRELRARGIKRISEGINVSSNFCFNFSDSPEESAARLTRVLRLKNTPSGVADANDGKLLFTIKSNSLPDILLYMNAHSSNFIAERIGAILGGPASIEQFLTERLHLPTAQVTVSRASGRERNRLTPRGLLTIIRALNDETNRQHLQLSDVMPIASDDAGTLRRRLSGTGLERAVVAKTGTLTREVDGGMASLAGIVYTTDNEPIVFAILDQGTSIWNNRQMEDQLLAEVVNGYATPRPIASPTPRHLLPSANLQIEESKQSE